MLFIEKIRGKHIDCMDWLEGQIVCKTKHTDVTKTETLALIFNIHVFVLLTEVAKKYQLSLE